MGYLDTSSSRKRVAVVRYPEAVKDGSAWLPESLWQEVRHLFGCGHLIGIG